MTRRSVLTKGDLERLGDQDAVAPAKTPERSVYHLPPKFQQGDEGVLERAETDGDEVTWFVQLMKTMSTDDLYLASRLLDQVINVAVRPGRKDDGEEDANAALAAVNGIGPKDTLEGLLAVQMVATHNTAMEMLRRALLEGQTVDGANHCVNRATKLLRTFTAQMQALNKYRGKGTEQKVIVEHVHINEGAQAIVGAVSGGKR